MHRPGFGRVKGRDITMGSKARNHSTDKDPKPPPKGQGLIALEVNKRIKKVAIGDECNARASQPAKGHCPSRKRISLVVIL